MLRDLRGVVGNRGVQVARWHGPLCATSDLAPAVSRRIGEDPANVPLRVVGPADSRPMPVSAFQGELKQIFGLCPVLAD
jgi:hypothetical protein